MRPFDARGVYCPAVRGDQVPGLAIRGAGATVFSGGLGLAIQIIGTVVLARQLTPGDFGLVALVSTFSLLFMNFGLNGFTEAVLQREEIDHFLISNLFWINAGVGLLLTIGFAAAGSLLAWFYRDPLVRQVSIGMSLTILLTSVSVQHLALLKRAMRFSAVSVNEIVARVASLVLSILMAWAGWGYWALVAGAVVLPLSQSAGAWYLCRWVPSLPRRAAGTASVVRFAMSVYGRFGLNYFSRNTDNLLVGWRFGAHSLGFYKKAYDLFALSAGQLSAPLTNVAVSALSRFNPRSPQYRQHLISGLSAMAFVGMGLSALFTLLGQDLIRLLLGPKWEATGQIFTYFAPGIGVMILYYIHGWIHLSIGRADRWFRWSLVEVIVTCLLFLLALPWGPAGIAVSWTASYWILIVPAFWYAGSPIRLGVKPLLAAVWKYLAGAVLAGCACGGVIRGLESFGWYPGTDEPLARVVTVSVIFGILYFGVVILLYGGYGPLRQFAGLLRAMAPAGSAKPAPAEAATPARAEAPGLALWHGDGERPLVSILIPAFNSEQWIADTLHSALAQTWESKEIIVVDDGSIDRTLAIARQFESECLRVVTQKNQGAAAARNTAFALSRGDYIQWLDADDLLAPDKIARQMEVLKQSPNRRLLLSSPFGRFRYRYNHAEFAPTALWQDLSPVEWLLRKMGQNIYMQTATWLVSRELAEAAGLWDTDLLSDDDGEYFCRVLLASDGVRFVPEAKVSYRAPWVGTLSYIGQSDRKIEAQWRSMRLHIGYLLSLEDSERVRVACLKYLQTCLIYFYPHKREILKEAEHLAQELGGRLTTPRLSWKYSWIKLAFGWGPAKRAEAVLPRMRWFVETFVDKTRFRFENRTAVENRYNLRVEDNSPPKLP
jgi:O-antigen/teichoic acid export membrane protein/glycosyltransferase involved in cell wall biosynthesis